MSKNTKQYNLPQLGYFLKFRHWRDAVRLLDYQLELKQTNKHFNTLGIFYYERLGKRVKHVKSKSYFKQRIANNLFYGLEDEFLIVSYPIPKSNLGLRNYKFLSYPMRVAYYAVGVYLLHVAHELLVYHRQQENLMVQYGGDLRIDDKSGNLVLKYDSIWYKPHYKAFRNRVRHEIKDNVDNKVVIHLDVQNYYDEISIPTLLQLLASNIKPSVEKQTRFDSVTQSQIVSFFPSWQMEREVSLNQITT